MPGAFRIEGHAIVSADGRIADAAGRYPPELFNAADWARFQSLLDASALVVLGRRGHEAHPNPGRFRLVATGRAVELEPDPRDPRATYWNPARVPIGEALAALVPGGGRVAVAGGTDVFELFRRHGYDTFDLSTHAGLRLPGGRPLFPAVAHGALPADLLGEAGLAPDETDILDEAAGVAMVRWRRRSSAPQSRSGTGA